MVLTRGSSQEGLTLNHLAQGSLTLNHFPPRRFNVKPLCQSSLHRRVSGLRALLYGTLRLQLTLAGLHTSVNRVLGNCLYTIVE